MKKFWAFLCVRSPIIPRIANCFDFCRYSKSFLSKTRAGLAPSKNSWTVTRISELYCLLSFICFDVCNKSSSRSRLHGTRKPSMRPGTMGNPLSLPYLVNFKPQVSVWAGFCKRGESTANWGQLAPQAKS